MTLHFAYLPLPSFAVTMISAVPFDSGFTVPFSYVGGVYFSVCELCADLVRISFGVGAGNSVDGEPVGVTERAGADGCCTSWDGDFC